ncbi:MAG: DUF4129 domain-containing protein, partial [Longimicrobiales bacterium]
SAILLGPLLFPGAGGAQERPEVADSGATGPITGTRIVETHTEPQAPSFGEVFQLHVTARLPRRSGVSVIDTLGPTNALRSAGAGRWEEGSAPGDSVEIRATFPVLPFRDGDRALPGLLIRTGEDRSAPGMPDVPERIPLGAVDVRPMAGFGPEGGAAVSRPPADVVGGDWSIWSVLAVGVLVLGALGLGRTLVAGGRGHGDGAPGPALAEPAGPLDREDALRRLDEIRARGWHRNGRVHDFYRASTDTLRRFVEGHDVSWDESLTSTELLGRATARWGGEGMEDLRPAVEIAERVKFGGRRPTAEEAERDWTAIRRWIQDSP